jgi:predicted phage terminase large subunit-like protein
VRFSHEQRLLGRSSPAGLALITSAGLWLPYQHLVLLNDRILAAVSGELHQDGKTGLIVAMPPRHGKSELVSKYTPAWFEGRFPDRRIILASYQAQFAATWGRKARDLLEEHGEDIFGVSVSQKSSAADHWEVAGHQGAMVTAGAGGAITGKGAELLIVDDPVKNQEEAASEVMREKVWDWWLSTARTRLHAGGAAIIVMTRWHEDDLVGRLLAAAAEDPEADQWEVLELPAIADSDMDALGRKPGQSLCPQLGYDEKWARRVKATLGTYYWEALYQQHPRPAEGLLFKEHDFRYWERHPSDPDLMILYGEAGAPIRTQGLSACVKFQTVDVAASEKQTADYTVVSTWAVTPARELLLIDRKRQRFELLKVGPFVESAYREHEPSFTSIESFGHGLGIVQELSGEGLPVRKAIADVDKVARALVAVARYEEHKVFHPRGPGFDWVKAEWEPELLAFPAGKNDDQVDTVSYAARELAKIQVLQRPRRERKAKTEMGGVRSRQL